MQANGNQGRWLARLAVPALLLMSFAARQGQINAAANSAPVVGPIRALAIDDSGNGWAWAAPMSKNSTSGALLRIENGAYRMFTDPAAVMPAPGVTITTVKLTAAGDSGWAGGVTTDSKGNPTFALWRLQDGAWAGDAGDLPTDGVPYNVTGLYDLSLSADGSTGWMPATTDSKDGDEVLYHLSDGAWSVMPMSADYPLFDVAISPNGTRGWGVGLRPDTADQVAFAMQGRNWLPGAAEVMPPTHQADAIAVTDSGNGWVLSSHFREGLAPSLLTRLKSEAAPNEIEPVPGVTGVDSDSVQVMHLLALDNYDHGLALGYVDVPDPADPTNYDHRRKMPVAYSLDGDNVTAAPYAALGLSAAQVLGGTALAGGANGAHTWLGWTDANGHGQLTEVRRLWTHSTPPAAAPLVGAGQCFAQVRYCLRGVFNNYWQAHGGLAQLGLPVTPEVAEQIGGKTYVVQYTERARLEWHPEYKGSGSEVLLGLLGNNLVAGRLDEAPFKPVSACAGCRWFKETGHNIGGPFLAYWQQNGGLAVFGLPRSEAFQEKSAEDGKNYQVQYFERNRIEYHPENKGTAYEFLLGLLGAEQFKATYGYAP